VKSAYHLAVQVENQNVNQEGTSSRGDGSRPLYNEVWTANVPTKVKFFAWRLEKDGLATQEQKEENAGKGGQVPGVRDGRRIRAPRRDQLHQSSGLKT
jgi:hypothetical protein